LDLDPRIFDLEAIDSETLASNELIEKLLASAPPIHEQVPAEIRAARARGEGVLGSPVHLEHAEVLEIPGPAGPIALRIFRHPAARGLYFHIHGGGWTLGSADAQDPMLDAIKEAGPATVVSVDYRLAPENPYPAGPDDCEAAALWLMKNAGSEFGSVPMAIGGESAGAHLAAVTLLRLRDRHGSQPFAGANLVYGAYDLSLTPSVRNWGPRNLVLSTPIIEFFTRSFVPDPEQRELADVSPLYADLKGLPSALFTVGGLDPLLDDTLFMASRWEAAGNETELAVYPGGIHGFNLFPGALGERALVRSEAFLARSFENS
jgi:acetyl esterase/lipase